MRTYTGWKTEIGQYSVQDWRPLRKGAAIMKTEGSVTEPIGYIKDHAEAERFAAWIESLVSNE